MSLLDRLKQLFAEAKAPTAPEQPVAPVAEVAGQPEARAERRRKKRIAAMPGTRVLIIDDSPTIVALLGRMLRQNHYTVLEAGEAETGLEIARRERPGLIFLDIVLPGMSGFTALRTLRHDPVTKDIPIVMISGNTQATEQFYVQRIGADNFMKKPFSRAEVFTYIERLLDEQFVPRRFNTFVHDTTLDVIPEPTDPIAEFGESDIVAEPDPTAADAPFVPDPEPAPATMQATKELPVMPPVAANPETATTPHPEPASAESLASAAEPEPEPASRDIFVDINAGWRRS